ncbi:hypothetical protein A0H81_00557 [Grifola frondosa]|uniref:Uncharacterized protein n=1 Tax=Grifola frondosa TaxID=5627 RepID=A0A1C7MPQ5_GRIFR|nr:hypothetical protein A0H81_00557 [Grifola frondosa]
MVAYLWLVWYAAPSKMSRKHWALAVTYEAHDRAYATIYEIAGDDTSSRYLPRVVRRVHLTSNHGAASYSGKILLGEINDNVLGALEMYSESSADLVNGNNRKRGAMELNGQDWAVIIIRSLEDAQLLPQVKHLSPL